MMTELTRVAAGEAGLAQTPLELLSIHLSILQHKPESACGALRGPNEKSLDVRGEETGTKRQ